MFNKRIYIFQRSSESSQVYIININRINRWWNGCDGAALDVGAGWKSGVGQKTNFRFVSNYVSIFFLYSEMDIFHSKIIECVPFSTTFSFQLS